MRVLALLLGFLLAAVPASAETLYFVGDGESVDLVTAAEGVDRTWPLSPDGHGDAETTFEQRGPQDEGDFGNGAIPTFVYDGTVTIDGSAPVVVHVFIEDSNALGCNSLDGQLFDGAGTALGPADHRHDISASGEVVEVIIEFDGIAGTFDGLAFQAAAPWTDCSALPYTYHWGSDAAAARIEFTAPAMAPEARTVHETLAGANASVVHRFGGTDDDYRFNWTNEASMLNITHNVTVVDGSANVVVTDADGDVVFEHNFTEDARGLMQVEAAPMGDWTIAIDYTAFNGTMDFAIASWILADGDPGDGSPDDGAGDEGGNATTPDQDSPGLALPALVAGLAVVLAARRR